MDITRASTQTLAKTTSTAMQRFSSVAKTKRTVASLNSDRASSLDNDKKYAIPLHAKGYHVCTRPHYTIM